MKRYLSVSRMIRAKPRTFLLACFILGSGITGLILTHLFFVVPVNHVSSSSPSFTFAVAGDWFNDWSSSGETRKVVTGVAGASPNFAIALGDLAYNNSETVAKSWCVNFKNIFANVLVLAGNHDSGESNNATMDVYNQYCPFPNIGARFIPGTMVDDNGTSYGYEYAFDYPTNNPIARFILISPDILWKCCGLSGNFTYSQVTRNYQWVSDQIDEAKSRGEWVIVGWHKNPISSLTTIGAVAPVWRDIWNLMFQKRVDLLLVGHYHVYERTYQLTCSLVRSGYCIANNDPNEYQKGDGVVYVIQGTGGASLRTVQPNRLFVAGRQSDTDHGFVKYTVSASSLTGHFVSVDSGFTDSFTINNPNPPSTPNPTSQESLFYFKKNPFVISDDNQSLNYWGNLPQSMSLSDSSTLKVSGQNSLAINIVPYNGTHSPVVRFHFGSPINFSSYGFVSVYWYGKNTWLTISIRMISNYSSAQFSFDFVDNWVGWARLVVPIRMFYILVGAPDWNRISDFAMVVDATSSSSSMTFYMDRPVVDSGLDQLYLIKRDTF